MVKSLARKVIIISLMTTFLFQIHAEIKLPALISSNMVLQRNSQVKLWGWGEAGEKVSIDCSWMVENPSVSINEKGEWEVVVATGNSREKQSIRFTSSSSEIRIDNILFGEVWLCSGQSNMEMPVRGFWGQPTFGSIEAIRNARNEQIRLFTVERAASKTELSDVSKHRPWESANPSNVSKFSAVAYFYAQQLQEILDVPVGIIHSSWGGSIIEAWLGKDALAKVKKIDAREPNLERGNREQSVLYNAMISPLRNYTIKGVLWYQGESNRSSPSEYLKLFSAMVEDWRNQWKTGEFPFYYVQIAPFNYDEFNTAYLREAQMHAMKEIPNSAMVSILDLGAEQFIHPPEKREVASRLVNVALRNQYGFDTVDDSGPIYESYEEKEGEILIHFAKAENGLWSPGPLKNFEIAGDDRVFYPAEAQIVNRRNILVRSDKVANPKAVRYAWKNWVEASLFDASLLPASSFRTDQWPISNTDTE